MIKNYKFILISAILFLVCAISGYAQEREEPITKQDTTAAQSLTPLTPIPFNSSTDRIISKLPQPTYFSFCNLLSNGSFESWTQEESEIPDSWNTDNPEAITQSQDSYLGSYATGINIVASLSQNYPQLSYAKGKKLVFGCWVKTSIANQIRISINDVIGQAFSGYHSGSGEWEFLTVTKTINSDATQLALKINNELGGSAATVDGACLYEVTEKGSICFTPNPSDNIQMPANLIYTDLQNKRVGINTNTPEETLHIKGILKATDNILLADNEVLTQLSADPLYINSLGDDTLTGNLTIEGTLQATNLIGNGSGLTDLPLSAYYTKLESDSLFAPLTHIHDDLYYTEAEVDSTIASLSDTYVNTTGDTMTGDLNVTGQIHSTGNLLVDSYLGIGLTSAPTVPLEVAGNIKANKFLLSDDTELKSSLWTKKEGTEDIYYNLGNVGIGTTSPISKLDVDGGAISVHNNHSGAVFFSGVDGNSTYVRIDPMGTDSTYARISAWDNDFGGRNLALQPDGGNVGIGTMAPWAKLSVVGPLTLNSDVQSWGIFDGVNVSLRAGSDAHPDFGTLQTHSLHLMTNGTRKLSITSDGNVGIGTTSPNYKLDITGTGGTAVAITNTISGGGYFAAKGIQEAAIELQDTGATTNQQVYRWLSDGGLISLQRLNDDHSYLLDNDIIVADANGYVGIGTPGPNTKLDISTAINGGMRVSDGTTVGIAYVSGTLTNSFAIGTVSNHPLIFGTNNSFPKMMIDTAGNVGIGVITPATLLHIQEADVAGYTPISDQDKLTIESDDINSFISFSSPDRQGLIFGDSVRGVGNLIYENSSDSMIFTTNGAVRMKINNSGNVGIGTTATPSEKLEVNGNVKATAFIGDGSQLTGITGGAHTHDDRYYTESELNASGGGGQVHWANLVGKPVDWILDEAGNKLHTSRDVGIGISPQDYAKLSVNGYSGEYALYINASGMGIKIDSIQTGIEINSQTGTALSAHSKDQYGAEVSSIDGVGLYASSVNNNAGLFDGNVRIMEDLIVDGNIGAKYQDVAEWVESEQKLTPGTVVVIDSNSDNKVLASNKAYDTKVCGVVSYQPGLSLGEKADNKYQIAHTGRVKVKVDASFGKISRGDLLVTSEKPGVAMKYTAKDYKPGIILGNALEPLNEGEEEILVLLSLQ